MSKDEIINNAIAKFHDECSKISNDKTFIEKLPMHEDLIIRIIL